MFHKRCCWKNGYLHFIPISFSFRFWFSTNCVCVCVQYTVLAVAAYNTVYIVHCTWHHHCYIGLINFTKMNLQFKIRNSLFVEIEVGCFGIQWCLAIYIIYVCINANTGVPSLPSSLVSTAMARRPSLVTVTAISHSYSFEIHMDSFCDSLDWIFDFNATHCSNCK